MSVTNDKTATLRAQEHGHAPVIAFDRATYNQGQNAQYDMGVDDSGTAHTVIAKGPGGGCYSMQRSDEYAESPVTATQSARQHKSVTDIVKENTLDREQKYIVRRLTPTECARLQGMPDWWCSGLAIENPIEEQMGFWREVFETHNRITGSGAKPKDTQIRKWLKNPNSDSAEYKMWGNGMALPCVLYVMEGVAEYLTEHNTQED